MTKRKTETQAEYRERRREYSRDWARAQRLDPDKRERINAAAREYYAQTYGKNTAAHQRRLARVQAYRKTPESKALRNEYERAYYARRKLLK